MIGLTHLAFGLLSGELFKSKEAILLSGVGSVLPDIDVYSGSIATKITFASGKNRYLKHRGIMHSLTVPLLIAVIYFALFGNMLILPFVSGYISHLFLDMFNPSGIPLFSPFYGKKIKFPYTVKTGSTQDYVLSVLFYGLFFLFLFQLF